MACFRGCRASVGEMLLLLLLLISKYYTEEKNVEFLLETKIKAMFQIDLKHYLNQQCQDPEFSLNLLKYVRIGRNMPRYV